MAIGDAVFGVTLEKDGKFLVRKVFSTENKARVELNKMLEAFKYFPITFKEEEYEDCLNMWKNDNSVVRLEKWVIK